MENRTREEKGGYILYAAHQSMYGSFNTFLFSYLSLEL